MPEADPVEQILNDTAIIKGLKQNKYTKGRTDEYLKWAEKIGKSRIEHIVSNKHRRAYERAAQVLGSDPVRHRLRAALPRRGF